MNDERARRERLQRVLARLNRIHEPAYGDRIPNHNSLYDWSPAAERDYEDPALREYIQDLRGQQPNTHPEVLRMLAQTQLDGERERRERARQSRLFHNSSDGSSQTEASLRSAAILQAVRRHPRFNARSRENMQRYILDRERYIRDNDPREPHPTRGFLPPLRTSETSVPYPSDPRYRLRRALLQDPSNNESPTSSWLQQTLTYLANLRDSTSYEDSLGYAIEAGFDTKEFAGHDDFLMDVDQLPPISETSLLAAGATFEGMQQADSSEVESRYDPWREGGSAWRDHSPMPSASRLNSLPPPEYIYPGQQWGSPRRSISPQPYDSSHTYRYRTYNHSSKEWPVKVILHSIDYMRMTLSATMIAYDVPPPSSSSIPLHSNSHSTLSHLLRPPNAPQASTCPRPAQKSIKTYLEGEIIDFRQHTLLTSSYPSTPTQDLTYWRKLPPFRSPSITTDADLARALTSQSFLSTLLHNWVLMRWKEKCFVEPRSAGDGVYERIDHGGGPAGEGDSFGLTISGFYYVAMRRSDGVVEGLYCDPGSPPFQFLRLERRGDGWVWPKWEFR